VRNIGLIYITSASAASRRLYRKAIGIVCVTAILIGPLSAQQKATDGPPATSIDSETPDPALVSVPEDPHLPLVLIIGDSISMGYIWEVRKLLAGKANVQHPDVNCGPTGLGVERVKQWIGEKHWDVIYLNFGLHDLKYLDEEGRYVTPDKGKQVTPVKQYQANLRKIISTLHSTGAKLIFATTTPVPSGATGRVHDDEIVYNTAAKEVMQEMGVEVDDLWSVVNPSLATLQQERNVHFTAEGYRVLGAEAASRIERDLPSARRP
jgi:lysophospholipase L1-like esterase